jgi:F-type H+-transporting ATPase subunit gamma
LGIIVIGSGQGMCGRFNESLLDFVTQRLDKLSYNVTHILGVGEYISGLLEMNGWDISHKINVPSSVEGINATVSEILLTLERWQSEQVHRSIIFHHRPQSNNSYTPRMHTLYPPDEQQFRPLKEKPWPTNNIPQYRMEPDKLLSALLHQFFFVSLYRAFAQSLASEHASRLVAMQTAEQKIDERIDHLTTQFRSQRQTAITAEVLDIIASWETSGDN